ncbi:MULTISPECIES: Fe2+-dependent dioxygenase [unclassified Paracoccus (in: a-proteobacteria)]|uniref:Fe2+-dependent dioxygenase n=1 Tax=unclassified Paracoccus (in: a-proteobacteria) TaxID=2688777 RepID=UPI0016047060|nr:MULTISPECIES: Fe2+-dependent dioxygenase [unclassified Paracoccus (in: a-proteobacteria)]MBB1492126.1 Fe2+-dependent dioxygenase [Paracoccus sp. MC1854]MBB1499583.1 Fe2+-dependent dioxygenase [Paracoccus sp. MC1862]QQO44201.1 Fe2+-dependent dioxygenase [Paracoccus sp. MC1862]
MLIQIPDVLSAAEVMAFREVLERAAWADGRDTAGDQAATVKNNLQIPPESPVARELGERVLHALARNPTYTSAALPLRVLPPMFNRYDPGMTFGAHTDNAIRTIPGSGGMRMRADVSTTIFLTAPEEYDGGELVVEDTYGTHAVKLPAGHMVVYPASSLHRVNPVTRGSRWGSFFWAQSMVRDDGRRAMLYDLDLAIRQARAVMGDEAPAVLGLVSHYHNLLRMWAEL